MSEYVHAAVDFIGQHPSWANLLVFLTAAAEAIAVIGSFIPGTTILIGVGAVVGLGHLPLWPVLVSATLGAIAGDGLSYWLGHHYRNNIGRIWPFSRRPELLSQGEAFFRRHGSKSVAIARFVPVTRAVVPVIAGALGMRPVRFYVANVLSAIAWSPLHILPGVLAGSFVAVVGGISGRLVAVLAIAVLLAIAAVWLLKVAVVRALPLLERAQIAIVSRARRGRGRAARVLANALDPDNPAAGTVMLLGAIVIICAVGFLGILQDVVAGDPLVQADAAISHLVQTVRTTWSDRPMVVLTMLGDTAVSAAVAVVALGWLIWRHQRGLAAGFAMTLALAGASVIVLKAIMHVPRPITLASGTDAFSFPSGHATMAAALYGMLAWLTSNDLPRPWSVVPIMLAGVLVGLIAASRVYLAAHWPSDVAAGMLLGFGLAGVYALVYHRTPTADLRPLALAGTVLATVALAGTWHVSNAFDAGMATYARRDQVKLMTALEWRTTGWRRLARRRIDLEGESEEPFVMQWAGPVDELRARLAAAGWQQPLAWSLPSAAGFARSTTPATELPALPLLHDGRRAALTMVMPGATPTSRTVLRAWPSGVALTSPRGPQPVLLASAIRERVVHPWTLASFPLGKAISAKELETALEKALYSAGDDLPIHRAPTPVSEPDILLVSP